MLLSAPHNKQNLFLILSYSIIIHLVNHIVSQNSKQSLLKTWNSGGLLGCPTLNLGLFNPSILTPIPTELYM